MSFVGVKRCYYIYSQNASGNIAHNDWTYCTRLEVSTDNWVSHRADDRAE